MALHKSVMLQISFFSEIFFTQSRCLKFDHIKDRSRKEITLLMQKPRNSVVIKKALNPFGTGVVYMV